MSGHGLPIGRFRRTCLREGTRFLVDTVAALSCLGVFVAFMAYFGLYSRHHLVAGSPDEEFAALAEAETSVR